VTDHPPVAGSHTVGDTQFPGTGWLRSAGCPAPGKSIEAPSRRAYPHHSEPDRRRIRALARLR
jgi:hypothetical protein